MTAKSKKETKELEFSEAELEQLIEYPTPNVIETLKREHKELFGITVLPSAKDANDGAFFVFKRPTRQIFQAAASVKNDMDAADVVLKNCYVWGPKELLEDMNVFQSVSLQFQEINKPRVSQLKKL